MCDSEYLRGIFSDDKDQIADGWKIVAEGDDGDYGHDLWMCLIGPDGQLYEQEASCCSCYGIEDQWGPVVTNLTAIKADLDQAFRCSGCDTMEEFLTCAYRSDVAKAKVQAIKVLEEGLESQL